MPGTSSLATFRRPPLHRPHLPSCGFVFAPFLAFVLLFSAFCAMDKYLRLRAEADNDLVNELASSATRLEAKLDGLVVQVAELRQENDQLKFQVVNQDRLLGQLVSKVDPRGKWTWLPRIDQLWRRAQRPLHTTLGTYPGSSKPAMAALIGSSLTFHCCRRSRRPLSSRTGRRSASSRCQTSSSR